MAVECVLDHRIYSEIKPGPFLPEEGQSVIEFLLLLPVLVSFTVVLVRINTAIQVSIVDQQYARANALYLTFNSAVYPEKTYQNILFSEQMNQMLLGVSDNPSPSSAEEGDYVPQATTQWVTRNKRIAGSNDPKSEPSLAQGRSLVRIRNTVTLCTPTFFDSRGRPLVERVGQPSELGESTQFSSMCASLRLRYE